MEVELRKSDTQLVGISETQAFSIPMSGKLMEILSDLYSDSRVAIVRELTSNMMDAVRSLPDAPPGIVKLPSIMDPEISFEDFGIGMSHETVVNVFAVYTASTKDQDNTNTGGWGLGGKSPFSYTTSWTLRSRFEGQERHYLMFKDEEGMSTCSMIQEMSTPKANGVKIVLPVQEEDMEKFQDAALYYVPFLQHPVHVRTSTGGEDIYQEVDFSHHALDPEGFGWSIPLHETMPRTPSGWKADQGENRYYHGNRATIVLANVPYALKEDSNAAALEGLHPDLDFLAKLPILLYMPPGALNVVPSRDSIQNTPRSREQVKTAFTKILREVERHVTKSTDLCETAEELWSLLHENYIARKTLGQRHKDREFRTLGFFHQLQSAMYQSDQVIDPQISYPVGSWIGVTVVRKAFALADDKGVLVHLPQEFYTSYKIIPFHKVSKWNSNWNWGPDKTLKREAEKRDEILRYKPSEVEFFVDDVLTASTERLKQSPARDRNGKKVEYLYLIKRLDREEISSKDERERIALMLSMPLGRILQASSLEEPEKELPEEQTVRGGVVVKDEYEEWDNVRVIAEVHEGDYNQLGLGFFCPTTQDVIDAGRSSYNNKRRDPLQGGWYLQGTSFKIVDPSWHQPGQKALEMAQEVKGLLGNGDVPWSWHDHMTGLALFAKNFTLDLDPKIWFPALPYILNKIQSKAQQYSPAAQEANKLFMNGLGPMQEMLTDPLIKEVRLPPALRRMQRLALLALPGEDSDLYAKSCYRFLEQKHEEPTEREILESRQNRMLEYIAELKQESPELFIEQEVSNRALLASKIAALEPESVLNARILP